MSAGLSHSFQYGSHSSCLLSFSTPLGMGIVKKAFFGESLIKLSYVIYMLKKIYGDIYLIMLTKKTCSCLALIARRILKFKSECRKIIWFGWCLVISLFYH